ncbi:MAG: uracil-DNA glycosylase [Acidobacteriia bacterium]|nr:uracil-DNA glycosylase [Terriglobia bacterium]
MRLYYAVQKLLANSLHVLNRQIVSCELCPRLRAYGREVARVKRRAYLDWEYWGKPVPGFGDPHARVLLIGLAPGAHGANRTGRMFTGDSSGDFLYRALYETGFASQAESLSREDGLELQGAYITAAARCAPPDNKPSREELSRCRAYLERELDLLKNVRVVVALGGIALRTYLSILRDRGAIQSMAAFPFGHDRVYRPAPGLPVLIASYHPSQQNTSTGKLSAAMLRHVFEQAKRLAE